MHHFFKEVRGSKVAGIEHHVRFAKSQYEYHLTAYIRAVVRRPLGKLLEFFEGIDEILKTNSCEEVGFRINYNKNALKKTVGQYPSKEVCDHEMKAGVNVLTTRLRKLWKFYISASINIIVKKRTYCKLYGVAFRKSF